MPKVEKVDRVVKCVGRRRLLVTRTEANTILQLWLGDPPGGKQLAALELEPIERDRLLLELTEAKANE